MLLNVAFVKAFINMIIFDKLRKFERKSRKGLINISFHNI